MPDYKKCVIYTIRTGEGLYVGSTCNFNNRKYEHKSTMNNEKSKGYNIKLYQTIRENDGAWDMQPHSEYPCNSKIEMNIEEERIRKELNANLNMYSCFQTKEERLKYHQEQDSKRRLNPVRNQYIKTYLKNWDSIMICECGASHKKSNKSRHLKTQRHINNI